MIAQELLEIVRQAQRVTVLTGAGVSAESGVPTFREAQTGLWAQYDPQELANPHAFERNPRLVWEWYMWRRHLIAAAQPNPGHLALAILESHFSSFTLITQNVDGLHRLAGSRNVVELHGNIMRTICFDQRHQVDTWADSEELPPRCPQCGSRLRPDVVWFGESLSALSLQTAVRAARDCDLFLSVGTSALVHPAASLPVTALEHRVPTVEINPAATPLTPYVSYHLAGPAGEILPLLVDALQ